MIEESLKSLVREVDETVRELQQLSNLRQLEIDLEIRVNGEKRVLPLIRLDKDAPGTVN